MISKDLIAASSIPLILSILKREESYGYAIIKAVRELSNHQMQWTDGMLYPVLHRLEKQGFIQSTWRKAENGRKRKYYSISYAGSAELERQKEQWRIVQTALERSMEKSLKLNKENGDE